MTNQEGRSMLEEAQYTIAPSYPELRPSRPELEQVAIDEIARKLRATGVTEPVGEARQIVAAAGTDSAQLRALTERRLAGEPLALVLGQSLFMGLPLFVTPGVLVPRTETELLGRTALEALEAKGLDAPRVVDMCCGAGNLAVSIARHVRGATVWASDLTDPCVQTARRNVASLDLASRVTVAQGDLFAGLAGLGLEGTLDLVVCNPPYISTGRLSGDRAKLLEHEPREAFDAGPYGLSIHQRVVREAPTWVKSGGWLMMEFGHGQARQVQLLFERTKRYANVRFVKDAEGNERVVVGTLA